MWIIIVDISSALVTQIPQNYLPETDLQIQAALQIEVAICFFYGTPCTEHFHRVKCPKSCFLCRICGEQSLSLVAVVFIIYSIQMTHSRPC